jgi:hypothetical protein
VSWVLALDAHALRYRPLDWSERHPELLDWRLESRYWHSEEPRITAQRVTHLLGAVRSVVDGAVFALWSDGMVHGKSQP